MPFPFYLPLLYYIEKHLRNSGKKANDIQVKREKCKKERKLDFPVKKCQSIKCDTMTNKVKNCLAERQIYDRIVSKGFPMD